MMILVLPSDEIMPTLGNVPVHAVDAEMLNVAMFLAKLTVPCPAGMVIA